METKRSAHVSCCNESVHNVAIPTDSGLLEQASDGVQRCLAENASPKFPAKLLREENRVIFFERTLGKDPFLFAFKATRRQTITAPIRHHLTGLRVNWEWGLHGFGFCFVESWPRWFVREKLRCPVDFQGKKKSAPDFVLVEFEGIGTPSPKKKAANKGATHWATE